MVGVEEYIEKELGNHPNRDVLVYYERGPLKLMWGFYIWNGYGHTVTTLTELREEGFERGDIKELKAEAIKLTIIETFGKFKTKL